MPYTNARELKEDVLFRASEPLTGSAFDAKAFDYINRAYTQLCSGTTEFTPEYVDDWWWLRSRGVLQLLPSYKTGSLSVTKDSTAAVLSVASANSLVGYRLKIDNHRELPIVSAHTAGTTGVTLDAAYNSTTNGAAIFTAMKTDYTLASDVAALLSPMITFGNAKRIPGLTPEALDASWPVATLREGLPQAFALTSEQSVTFSHGGQSDGTTTRIEYRYRPTVTALTDSTSSIPLVPTQWRHTIADMALVMLLADKNDNRAELVAAKVRNVIGTMVKENRRRLVKTSQFLGHIVPRRGSSVSDPLRTESGLIIG